MDYQREYAESKSIEGEFHSTVYARSSVRVMDRLAMELIQTESFSHPLSSSVCSVEKVLQ